MTELKNYRLNRNLSQEYVTNILGVTQQQYSRLESGLSIMNINQLLLLCELYNVTPNDLLRFSKVSKND